MKYLKFLGQNRIQSVKKANPRVIIHPFLWGLLLLVCGCFAVGTLASAGRSA